MKRRIVSWTLLGLLLFVCRLPAFAADTDREVRQRAVVFVLDASNSMNQNDPNRLAMDSVAQLVYSLPSDVPVGAVAYHQEVVLREGFVEASERDRLVRAVQEVSYTGYTNAGAGLSEAIALMQSVSAEEKTVVLLSDGEIFMQDAAATAASEQAFAESVAVAAQDGIRIHVIGLGDEMAARGDAIFEAARQTQGQCYEVSQAGELLDVMDSILTQQLGIQKTTAAIVEADGGTEQLTLQVPAAHADVVRVLLLSEHPISHVTADFQAVNGRQISGAHYTLLELQSPGDEQIHLRFQGQAGSQVKAEVMTEHHISVQPQLTYADIDEVSAGWAAQQYDQRAELVLSFYSKKQPGRQVLTEQLFEGAQLQGRLGQETWSAVMKQGIARVPVQGVVTQTHSRELTVRFDALQTNVICEQPLTVQLQAAPPMPTGTVPWVLPAAVAGSIGLVAVVVLLAGRRRAQQPQHQPAADAPQYGYTGRLNLYMTRTKSGQEMPPLTYNLFRVSGARELSLQEILEGCQAEEIPQGARGLIFRPGAQRSLILSNESGCTVMQAREILMKGRSYQVMPNSKLDITFEDEVSEMVIQYRDVKARQAAQL